MRLIFQSIKPFGLSVFFVVVFNFGQVIADLLLPSFMSKIVDVGIAKGDIDYILSIGVLMLLVSSLGMISAGFASLISSRVSSGIGQNLRSKLFKQISSFSESEFDNVSTASLITRTTNDTRQVQNTMFQTLRMTLRAPLMCIGGIIMAIEKDSSLSLILLIILPLAVLVIMVLNRKIIPLFKVFQKNMDKLNLILRENIIGVRIIKAFNRIQTEVGRFAKSNNDIRDVSVQIDRLFALMNPLMMLFMNGMIIMIVWVASFRIDDGSLMIGDMMAFIQYAYQIFMSLMMVTMLFIMFPRALVSAERISEVLDIELQIKDSVVPADTPSRGELKFDDVSFLYDDAERPVLCNISFSASPGESIAVIGGTGSGKSSLLKLIPRFFDVRQGQITIDGVDVRDINLLALRDMIAYVPQKNTLFRGSISENIRFAKAKATDEEIHEACRIAQATEFIEQTEDGYNHQVAQGGTNLSGGQKQRLAIARAIVKRPKIYLFDDSFSALDFRTSSKLQAALKEETKDAVVITVAQRITSIMHADKILVLDNGVLSGIGTHEELLETSEIYREICNSQNSENNS